MRVLVTGAAGKIGQPTCRALLDAGHDVIAVDPIYFQMEGVQTHVLRVTRPEPLYPLLERCDAVVHMGNYPNGQNPDFTVTYSDNVAANMAVFHAAIDVGIRHIVFISSVQTFATAIREESGQPPTLPYLPIDGHLPANPDNVYGLSKAAGEDALRYFCRHTDGLTGIALRFPYIAVERHLPYMVERFKKPPTPRNRMDEVGTYLMVSDAADLIRRCIDADDLTGYHSFFPAAPNPMMAATPAELRQTRYADIPWRGPDDPDAPLVDISEITEKTGWTPQYIITAETDVPEEFQKKSYWF